MELTDEISRMEGEGCMAHTDGGEHMDQKRNIEIERLNALLKVDGPGPTREERAIEVLRAMLFTLDLGIDDMLAGGEECPETLDRLLRHLINILGGIRGLVMVPARENLTSLIKDCQDVLAGMAKARQAEYETRRAQVDERYRRMAAGMGDESGHASAN